MKTGGGLINNTLKIVAGMFVIVLLSGCIAQHRYPVAQKGVLDLSGWDFKSKGPVKLKGEWVFYQDRFFDGSTIEAGSDLSESVFIKLPGNQGDRPIKDCDYRNGFFQLKTKLAGNDRNVSLYGGESIGIYKIWIDNRMVVSPENWGVDLESPYALYTASDGNKKTVVITLQAVNYPWQTGTPPATLMIGGSDSLKKIQDFNVATEYFIVSSLLIIALYHLFLFLLRKEEKSTLYFTVFCLLWAFYLALSDYGAHSIISFIPEWSWLARVKAALIAKALIICVMVLFITSLYPYKGSKVISKMVMIFSLTLVSATLPATETMREQINFVLHIFLIPFLGYFVFVVTRAAIQKKDGAMIILLGFGCFVLTAILDILTDLSLIRTSPLLPFGLLVFVLFQGVALAKRFSNALKDSEKLAGQLKANLKLKKEIQRRKQTERDLKTMHQRLSRILDTMEDAVIAVNENFEICFSNSQSHTLLDCRDGELLGRPVTGLFLPEDQERLNASCRTLFKSPGTEYGSRKDRFRIARGQKPPLKCSIWFEPLEVNQEVLLVMILQHRQDQTGANEMESGSTMAFVRALNSAQSGIRDIQEALDHADTVDLKKSIKGNFDNITMVLSRMEARLAGDTDEFGKKKAAVSAMNLALDLWMKTTGNTKADLAEQSGIWKVYVTCNGHERTQTLDKYLDINTLPKNPRWQNVVSTVDFVLLECEIASPKKANLEELSLKLRLP